MVISDAHRFLFVHVQKTGGSTIDRRLDSVLPDVRAVPRLNRHATLGRILRTEPALSSYWTVGFVRNPFARMVSWFRMVERFKASAESGNAGAARYFEEKTFIGAVADRYQDLESFVLQGTEDWPRLRMPQVSYLTSATRRADLIGRQETLEADLRAIFARLDLPWTPLGDADTVNVDRTRPDYRDLYTGPMRRRVEEVFAADLATFDYSY